MRILKTCGLALLALAGPAAADSLRYEPAAVELSATNRSATMVLRNEGAEPLRVLVRAYRWDMDQGSPRLWATDELRVTPEAQLVAPGEEVQVAVALNGRQAPATENTFRLIVEELPAEKGAAVAGYAVPVTVQSADAGAVSAALRD